MPEDKSKPIAFLHYASETRAASSSFLQVPKLISYIKQCVTITMRKDRGFDSHRFSSLSTVLRGPEAMSKFLSWFYKVKSTIKPRRAGKVYIILALGDLSFENTLPMLGASIMRFNLKSRETLHFMGDLQQMYGGGGGGSLISFIGTLYCSTTRSFQYCRD